MESSAYLESKKKFSEELRNLEHVKNIGKMKTVNILIYISLIIITPIIVLLGFYYNNTLIYILAGIVLIFGFIYSFINARKCRNLLTKLIQEKIVSFFNTSYGTKRLSEKSREEICERISELFTGNAWYDYSEHLTRFAKDGKNVDLVAYTEEEYPYRRDTLYFCNFILASKIEKEGIFYLTCKDDLISNKNNLAYDKIFLNHNNDINKMLKEIGGEHKKENHIDIEEAQKKKLIEIYNKYSNRFTIIIKDGYLYIKMRKRVYTSFKCLEEIFDFQNCLHDLLLNFL